MAEEARMSGSQQIRQHVDDFLAAAAPGLEEVTGSKAFGALLAQSVGNFVALHRIGNDVLDLAIRNVRLAGRADVTSLHKQLARTEDKLEHVLEVVERLEDELAQERRNNGAGPAETGDGSEPARGRSRSTGRTSSRSTGKDD